MIHTQEVILLAIAYLTLPAIAIVACWFGVRRLNIEKES